MPVDTALPTKKTRTTLFAENCESCALFKEGGCEFSGPCTGGGMEMDEGMEMGRPKGIDGCPRFSGQEFGEEDPVINSLRNILTRKTFKDFHLASASLHGTKISSTLDIVKDAQKTVEETNQDLKEWKSKFTVANRGFRNQEKRFKDLSRKLSTTHSSGMSATARKAQQKRLDVIRNKRDKFSEEADMAEDRIKEFRNELQADKEHLKSAIKVFKMLVKNEIKKRTQNKNFSQDMDSGQEFGRPKGSRNRPLKARRTAKLESILNSYTRKILKTHGWKL
ncbi:MAG: hypothetical protein ACE5FY_07670 [Nitrospiria bacterium]